MGRAASRSILWIGVMLIVVTATLIACGWRDDARQPGSDQAVVTRMFRLSEAQYLNSVRDIFGPTITLSTGMNEAETRYAGLLAAGEAQRGMTSSAYAAAETMAGEVAAQVFAPANRGVLMPCQPVAAQTFDEACARRFVQSAGRLLYRRTLNGAEVTRLVSVGKEGAAQLDDFYGGMQMALRAMLVSPNFLFRIEESEPDPDVKGTYRLTSVSRASRLSFMLWNTTPDEQLLDAAESGKLLTRRGSEEQVARLMGSPRLVEGVRTFFSDMLGLDGFRTFSKDAQIFPNFTVKATADAPEQALRTIVDMLVFQQSDYRDLFTTRKTFMTPALASAMRIPFAQNRANGAPEFWEPYEFPEDSPYIGLLAQPAFIALNTHPGRTSPTLRGKALREKLLCQEVPPPPANVEFKIAQDTSNPDYRTARQRLRAHATEPVCKGCHKVTDPLGLTLEMFDSAGAFRTTENGAKIDTSGEVDGVPVSNMRELTAALHDNPALTACVVQRLYVYGSGRRVNRFDRERLRELTESFRRDGDFLALLEATATSDSFFREMRKPEGAPR